MSVRLYAKHFYSIVLLEENLKMGLKCIVATLEPDKFKHRFHAITGSTIKLEKTDHHMVYTASLVNLIIEK
jgi:hypothetical protein